MGFQIPRMLIPKNRLQKCSWKSLRIYNKYFDYIKVKLIFPITLYPSPALTFFHIDWNLDYLLLKKKLDFEDSNHLANFKQ